MKRYLVVLALACALVLAVGTSSAFAGDLLPVPSQSSSQDQNVSNNTSQENTAVAISPTVLSGNNLALINGGDQKANAGTTQNQGNFNWTNQKAVQVAEQDRKTGSSASKHYDKGKSECSCKKAHSSGPSQRLEQDQDVKNRTEQENKAFAFSPTFLAGNNLALINKGDQSAWAGTTQNQGNFKWTRQKALQGAFQGQSTGYPGGKS